MDGLKSRVLELVDDPASISGILLYGSQTGLEAEPCSDIDLICVLRSRAESQRREVKILEGTYLDVYYASRPVLTRRLRMPSMSNNNFILNGFMEGRILLDRDGSLRELSNIARAVWRQRPPLPTKPQVEFVQQQLTSTCYSLERSLVRAAESPVGQGLFRLRCSEVFSKMVYEYCRRRGEWTDSMPRLLRRAATDCPELHRLAHRYLVADSNEQVIASLKMLLDFLKESLYGSLSKGI